MEYKCKYCRFNNNFKDTSLCGKNRCDLYWVCKDNDWSYYKELSDEAKETIDRELNGESKKQSEQFKVLSTVLILGLILRLAAIAVTIVVIVHAFKNPELTIIQDIIWGFKSFWFIYIPDLIVQLASSCAKDK